MRNKSTDTENFTKHEPSVVGWEEEIRYFTQELLDIAGQKNESCLLVYHYKNFKSAYVVYVSKTNSLYEYLKEDPCKLFKIVFTFGKTNFENPEESEKKFLQIKKAKLIEDTENELIYNNVTGVWLENNFDIIKLANERNIVDKYF